MSAISTLLPPLLNLRGRSRPQAMRQQTYPFQGAADLTHSRIPSATDFIVESAVPFLTSVFVWLDIFSNASVRRKYHHLSDHGLLLLKSAASPEELFGCQTWALLAIAKITDLDAWRHDCEQRCVLSLTELVQKSLDLRALLTSGFPEPEAVPEQRLFNSTTPSSGTITAIFATAALIYLEVIVSGANPNLLEIRHSVARAVAYFRSIAKCNLSPRLAWPLCVTGCLASGDERAYFTQLMVDKVDYGLRKALEVVKQCWTMRDLQGMVDADWAVVIQTMGGCTLLV